MAEAKRTPQELRAMAPQELQNYGHKEFADLQYRVEVAERIADRNDAQKLVTIDDVVLGVPEAQRHLLHGLPGYERSLYPTLWMAPGFKEGASIVMGAPPNPAEMAQVMSVKQEVEHDIGRKFNYEVLFEKDGELIDLTKLDHRTYLGLCLDYADRMDDTENAKVYGGSYHADTVAKHAEQVLGQGRTLVVPFQTTTMHYEKLQDVFGKDRVALPNVPDMSKAKNNLLLRKEGFNHLPHLVAVSANGDLLTTYDELEAKKQRTTPAERAKNKENVQKYAAGILQAVDRLAEQGMKAMVKLDADGVSGLGNVSRNRFADVYDPSKPAEYRMKLLTDIINTNMDGDQLPLFGVIEEFIEPGVIEGVTQDYTLCGQMVDGVFLPTSVNPFATTDGVYDRQWCAPRAEQLGEDPEEWQKLIKVYQDMGEVFAKHGYTDGILAGDVFVRKDGTAAVHDYNFRRGGRSTPETMMSIIPTGWFEGQVEVPLKKGQKHHNRDLFLKYTGVSNELQAAGIIPFSSGFGYFGKDPHGVQNFLKFKLMAPMSIFRVSETRTVPRSEQLDYIRKLVKREVKQSIW